MPKEKSSRSPKEGSSFLELEKVQKTGGKLSLLSALYVELLGTLLPGLFAVLLGGSVLVLTFSSVYAVVFESSTGKPEVLKGITGVLGSLHYEIAVITVVASYVIGSVFFRRDPKMPDATSAVHVWMDSSDRGRRGLAVQGNSIGQSERNRRVSFWKDVKAFVSPQKYLDKYNMDAQFPYRNFRCYLAARRLTHLTNYIPWCPDVENTFECRTKMFINMLKIRLQAFAPRVCWDIIRNEAHVRLATSIWYVCDWLCILSVVCLGILLFTGLENFDEKALRTIYPAAVVSSFVLVLCVVMKFQLRKCIHYMRVREVFYVLETSHIVQQLDDRFNIKEVTGEPPSKNCAKCERIIPEN